MIEINSYLLCKMGWTPYSMPRGIGHGAQIFADDPLVRFFIDLKDDQTVFIIKDMSDEEKQNSKNLYKFIKMEYNSNLIIDGIPKFTITEFDNNQKMFILVMKNKACNLNYQRFYTINNILNEENRS